MKKYLFVTTTALGLIVGAAGVYAQSSGSGSSGGATGGAAAPGGSQGSGGSMGSGSGSGAERGNAPAGVNRGTSPQNGTQPGSGPRSQAPRASDHNTGQAPQGSEHGQSPSPRGERGQGRTQRDMDRNQPSSRDPNQGQAPREGTRERTQAPREGGASQTERSGRDGQTRERSRENTGAAPSSVSVTTEQRTRIKEHVSVLQSGRAANVNFKISVGTTVPRTVRVYDLPLEIVEIVPAYRGYKYIYVEDEIVIVDPRTLRIVAVIEV